MLLIDGEELVGAMQNRVLNTSVMVAPGRQIKIPVSCTESGRWQFRSRAMGDSGVVMPQRARFNRKLSVDDSLRNSRSFRSNQSQVWDDISDMSSRAGESSPTEAMRDVFESRLSSLERLEDVIGPLDQLNGMGIVVDGETVGFELFSRSSAFESLSSKLIKSYAMDAIVRGSGLVNQDMPRIWRIL